jgi:hypothetical protein
MVRRSKNEGGDANCKTAAGSARDTEKPPYKLTAREKEALAKFEAASETRGPRLKVQADGATAKFRVDHPDEAVGILALMRAIETTDLDFYDGLMGHLVNASRERNALSQSGTNFMLSVVKGIEPRDQIEAMLAAQMAAVHNATMTFARRHPAAGQRSKRLQQADSHIRRSGLCAERLSVARRATDGRSACQRRRGRAGDCWKR